MDPQVNTTAGSILPQPVVEGNNVTFSGYKVIDPGNDTWNYFWDFDLDGEYEINGSCINDTIPPVTKFYDDDYMSDASLLVVDEDGGTNNISVPGKHSAGTTSSSTTGYVRSTYKYTSSYIYVMWQYTYDYYRGYARIDLSQLPEEAIVQKVVFKGYVQYNNSVNRVGVRLSGSGTRLFGLNWMTGDFSKDLTNMIQTPAGKAIMDKAIEDGWIGLGFDYESPLINRYNYGYMRGYSWSLPEFEIEYITYEPGCLIPVFVNNVPPVINASNITVSPTEVFEGQNITVSNFSFYDPGNDTYEYNIKLGEYESGWLPLGERPIPGGAGGPANYPFLKTFPSTFTTNSPVGATRGYRFTCESDNLYVVELGVIIPTAYASSSKRFVTLWDRSTQKKLAQVEIKNLIGNTWTFERLSTPVKLTKGGTYTVAEWGTGYFYRGSITSTPPWGGDTNIKVSGTDYANGGNQDTYPTSYLAGYIYGIPDIGYAIGTGGGAPSVNWNDNIAKSGTPSASAPRTLAPGCWNDGILTPQNGWVSCNGLGNDNSWMEYTWTTKQNIGGFGIYQFRPSGTRQLIGAGDMQYWDGSKYISLGGYNARTDGIYTLGQPYFKELPNLVQTTKFRLFNLIGYAYPSGQVSNPSVAEWEVYSGSGGVGTEGWGVYGPGYHFVNMSLNMTAFDDHPLSGTSQDELNVTVMVRDDDDHKLIPETGIGPTEEGPKTIHPTSSTNNYYNGRKLVMRGSTLYAVLQNYQSPNYNILLAKSTDGGDNWEYTRVNDEPYFTSGQYYPTLAIDSTGVLHVAWRGYASSGSATSYNIRYACSRDDGKTWGERYNASTGYGYQLAMTVDLNDKVHIAFTGYQSSSPYKVFYLNRSASGVWGNRKMVSESNLYCYDPAIDVDTKGNAHIVWRGYRSSSITYYAIRHRMFTAATGKWSQIINLTAFTSSTDYHLYPSIACDKQDNAHVVWSGRDSVVTTNYNIRYMKFDGSTQKWGSMEYITRITPSNPYQYWPSIAVNNESKIDVVWSGYRSPTWSSPYIIHHATKVGTTWDVDWNFYVGGGYQYKKVMHSFGWTGVQLSNILPVKSSSLVARSSQTD
jgi:hypothetical protein